VLVTEYDEYAYAHLVRVFLGVVQSMLWYAAHNARLAAQITRDKQNEALFAMHIYYGRKH